MFQRLFDDFKQSTDNAVRLTALAATCVLALSIAVGFLSAAGFVFVLRNYGLIPAFLAGASLFLLIALIAACAYILRQKALAARKARAAERTKSAIGTMLADPVLVAAGLQIVRAIGIKKLIPALALSGLAIGLLASRQASGDQTPAE
jgi:hypothetical protein